MNKLSINRFLNKLIVLVALFSAHANAGIIEHREYNGVSNGIVYIQDLGIEFLNLNMTKNKSIAEAIAAFSSDGFGVSNFQTLNQLFIALGAPNTINRNICENAQGAGNCRIDYEDTNAVNSDFDWLYTHFTSIYEPFSARQADLFFKDGDTYDNYRIRQGTGVAYQNRDSVGDGDGAPYVATFMSRTISSTSFATNVPEPGVLGLLILSLASLCLRKQLSPNSDNKCNTHG